MSCCRCCDCEDREETRAYANGMDEGIAQGREEGYEEGQHDLRKGLLEEVAQRMRGADLPTPIYDDVMSLEEVQTMIRRMK